MFAACGSNDGMVRRSRGIAQHAIAQDQVQACDLRTQAMQAKQVLMGFVVQAADALDRLDLVKQLGQNGGLITAACAHFQHFGASRDGHLQKQLQHACHDLGFADGLVKAYGQAGVLVGLASQGAIDKMVAFNRSHGTQNFWRGNVVHLRQALHHALACSGSAAQPFVGGGVGQQRFMGR